VSDREAGTARLLGHVVYELIPMKSTLAAAEHLPFGAAVSVTASPAKGMLATVELCEALAGRGFHVIPHLSARLTKSAGELGQIVERLAGLGLTDAFVVGGDGADPGDFPDALSLLEALAGLDHSFTRIGVAAYPEGHPVIDDARLRQALLDKQPHASYMTTQMCFDAERISTWIGEQRLAGIALPVVIGVPGVIETAKLVSIGARIGVGTSMRHLAKNRRALWRLLRPGRYRPRKLVDALARIAAADELDIAGVHVFTFNQVEASAAFYEAARR
jgi:methylenetetrahydrofolate reductase (NADPH)